VICLTSLNPYNSTLMFIRISGLRFKCVDKTLVCEHSNESYWAVLSCGTVCYAERDGINFYVCGWNPSVWPFKWKLLSSTFMLCFTRLFVSVESRLRTFKCLMSLHFWKFQHFSQLWSLVLSKNHFYFCIPNDSNLVFTWQKLLKWYTAQAAVNNSFPIQG